MGYFMLGICAGIIAMGLAFSIVLDRVCKWEEEEEEEEKEEEEEEEEEDEEPEEDLINDGYQDLW